jgi:hypothetical protein
MTSKFALVIANTEYTDPGLAQLTAPGQDAKELVRVLDSPDLCGFTDVVILVNENSLKVSETIDYFFANRRADDLLMMYFSGHGVRDEFGALYLAVKNTNRDRLRSTAIKADFVREAMDQSRSKRQILILDCCNSGAFAQGTKGEVGGSIGTAKAFEGTGYGRIVLTASDSTQFAWEGDKVVGEGITNSLFTHFLVKGLEGEADQNWDGKITIDDLYDYAYDQVVRLTPKQTPGKWSYKQQGEIFLRENLQPKHVKPAPLPPDLLALTHHQNSSVRKAAVEDLVELLDGQHLGLARAAQEKLSEMADQDDSLTLRKIAVHALTEHGVESNKPAPVESKPVEIPKPAEIKKPVKIKKDKPISKRPAPQRVPAAPQKSFSSLLKSLQAVNPLPRLTEWKLTPPRLEKRLVLGISGTVLGIALLAGASQFFSGNWSIFGSTPTASATLTRPATSTSAPTHTITPRPTETNSPIPALVLTDTSTPTLTFTPTSTNSPFPTATIKPTKKQQDPGEQPH